MEKNDFINRVEDLTADQIAEGILTDKVTFEDLRNTGKFDASKQRAVKAILKREDDVVFASATSIADLERYLQKFPNGNNVSAASDKIQKLVNDEANLEKKIRQRNEIIRKIHDDINEYTPDEVVDYLSEDDLESLCNTLNLDASIVKNFTEPDLKFNDIPQDEQDIPADYTDIFFWGIPSSGKTCALASILNTITKNYTMEAPDTQLQFGSTYRTSLVNIFRDDVGYLPDRTNVDRTQYMPFLLYRRGEQKKRKISFFELSGEVFKYFFEIVNNTTVEGGYDRGLIDESFRTLDLLLNSNNRKIHYFFIDYNQETKNRPDRGYTQSDYLTSAAVYFRDRNSIFRKKTDAVYVIVTKSDEINSDNANVAAREFLDDNFGNFMDFLKSQCQRNSIDFRVKLFSIGDVYFKRICKIDRSYSNEIIDDLLKRVRPADSCWFTRIFNS